MIKKKNRIIKKNNLIKIKYNKLKEIKIVHKINLNNKNINKLNTKIIK